MTPLLPPLLTPCGGSVPLSRFTEGLGEAETQQLEDEMEDAAKKLASDIDLFGEMGGDGEAR